MKCPAAYCLASQAGQAGGLGDGELDCADAAMAMCWQAASQVRAWRNPSRPVPAT